MEYEYVWSCGYTSKRVKTAGICEEGLLIFSGRRPDLNLGNSIVPMDGYMFCNEKTSVGSDKPGDVIV